MQKLLLSLATLALSASAFAQGEQFISGVSFNAPNQTEAKDESGDIIENGYTVPTTNTTVKITFEGYNAQYVAENGIMPVLMWTTGTGFAVSDPMFEILEPDQSEISFDLKDNWGEPYMGSYFANLMICFMDAEFDYIYNEEGEPLFWEASYTTENKDAATLKFVYPNGDWDDETFAEAYNRGEISFAFTNEISLKDNQELGTIFYERFDGETIDEVPVILGVNAEAMWNRLDGYYTITVKYSIDGISASELSEIIFSINELTSMGESVEVEPVFLENDNPNMKRLAKNTANIKGITFNIESSSVYSTTGILLKENVDASEISNLPKGLYIVNGKKVVVK